MLVFNILLCLFSKWPTILLDICFSCRMHDEVKTMMQQGEIHKDIIENANKYITLALPAHHDQGMFMGVM